LQILQLDNNNLSGTIPASLGNLSQLQRLSFFLNQLTGNIPAALGNLLNLQSLNLDFNQLTGSIPPGLGNLSQLHYLSLSHNQLSGSIPASLGKLSNLLSLVLNYNQLTGNIPDSLSLLLNLLNNGPIGLSLENNQLSGIVPLSLKNLSTEIALHDNKLTFDHTESLVSFKSDVLYAPQAHIPIYHQNNTLSVSAGGTPSKDTFRFYKDGLLQTMQTGDSTFSITTTGKYNIVVTNSIATQLTLYSDTINIAALVVTLSSFTATKKETSVLLNWQTANEQNNAYFIVERSNGSNMSFKEAGRISSLGNSSKPQQYYFEDVNPFGGGNYYRLKQVDADGKITYSKVAFVDFAKKNYYKIISQSCKRRYLL